MADPKGVKYEQEIPDILKSMAGIHEVMDAHGFDRTIHHLVQLRASQIIPEPRSFDSLPHAFQ